MTPIRRTLSVGTALLAALGAHARRADAQAASYFPNDAIINYVVPGEAFIGINQSLVPSSPTVGLVTGGHIESDTQTYGGSTFDVTGGAIDDILDAFSTSHVNISGGSVGTYLEADNGSTVTITGGAVGSAGRIDFYDNTTGAYTFVGAGLSAALDPGGPTFGTGTPYTLSGRLLSGQSVTGDIIVVAAGATMFTLSSAPELSPAAAYGLGVLGLGALALRARRRKALDASCLVY